MFSVCSFLSKCIFLFGLRHRDCYFNWFPLKSEKAKFFTGILSHEKCFSFSGRESVFASSLYNLLSQIAKAFFHIVTVRFKGYAIFLSYSSLCS